MSELKVDGGQRHRVPLHWQFKSSIESKPDRVAEHRHFES